MATQKSNLEAAQEVLQKESDALALLGNALNSSPMSENFERACELILQSEGKVVVSGMGKCSHIGAKIASTFASTGAIACSIHPAEASHGDMGMIDQKDVCLLLSNSGESNELMDIIHYTKRHSIPLIAISSQIDSTLMRAADCKLLLPKVAEACPLGLAPTTSTTMMLALGDALAVVQMKIKGFGHQDFGGFHPGGKLGVQLSLVKDVMHKIDEIPVLDPKTPMSEAVISMSSKNFGVALVANSDGKLSGIITDGDLRRNISDIMSKTAKDVASKHPTTILPDEFASSAIATMNKINVSVLPVVNESFEILGLVHIHDLLRKGIA